MLKALTDSAGKIISLPVSLLTGGQLWEEYSTNDSPATVVTIFSPEVA